MNSADAMEHTEKKGFGFFTYVLLTIAAFGIGTGAGYTVMTIDSPRHIKNMKVIEKDTASVEEAKKIIDEEITVAKATVKYWTSLQKPPTDIGALIATSLLDQSFSKYSIQTTSGKAGPVIRISLPNVPDRICNAINRDIESNPDAGPGRTTSADQDVYPVQCIDNDQIRNNSSNTVLLVIGNAGEEQPEPQQQTRPQAAFDTPYKDLR